ncbi:MAG: phosphate signaling complex protein PhoU [Clostridiaceae bacterium]|nr:phosphate signaling complex protein PhoU [Clostridia bacterium]MDY3871329.1 phosphate signaling complex protein PhoU [Clostridiaceae bacterium]
MRSRFDEQLDALHQEMIAMGGLCEKAIALSAKALLEGNRSLTLDVPRLSAQIDQHERDIESLCFKLLMRQQPVARDLRVISAALKMVTDMERIGNQSADIAEIIVTANISAKDESIPIHEMAVATIKMVSDSIEAFIKQDLDIASAVVAYDDVVDGYFDKAKRALIRRVTDAEADGEYALDLLMIAKYFERIGDHAVNIAQWVRFSITGSREEDVQ